MTTNAKKAIVAAVAAIASVLSILFGLSSCSVVRTVTTEAQTINRGDTVVQITTKTIESYSGEKR